MLSTRLIIPPLIRDSDMLGSTISQGNRILFRSSTSFCYYFIPGVSRRALHPDPSLIIPVSERIPRFFGEREV